MPLTRSFAASPSATDTTAGLRADTQPGGPHGPARQASLSRSAARRARSRCRLWNGTAPAPATGEAVRSLRGRSVVRHAQDRESGTPWSSVVQADTQRSLPLASRSFGAVLCALVGEHLATLLEPLPEMHRVLTPGGRMVFSVYHLPWPPSASRPTSRRASSAASARTGTSSMIIAAHYVLCRDRAAGAMRGRGTRPRPTGGAPSPRISGLAAVAGDEAWRLRRIGMATWREFEETAPQLAARGQPVGTITLGS